MASTTSFPSSCPLPGIPCFFPGVALAISSSPITLYKPIWNWLATYDGPFSFHNLCQWVFSRTPHSQFRSLDVKNIRLNSWHFDTYVWNRENDNLVWAATYHQKITILWQFNWFGKVIERWAEEPWCTLLALNFDAELVTDQAATPAHKLDPGTQNRFQGVKTHDRFWTQEFYF